jgi:hypothetical protein
LRCCWINFFFSFTNKRKFCRKFLLVIHISNERVENGDVLTSPVVNFINILRTAFSPKKLKTQSATLYAEQKKLLVKCWWNWHLAGSLGILYGSSWTPKQTRPRNKTGIGPVSWQRQHISNSLVGICIENCRAIQTRFSSTFD